ncbi:nuclease-related domain-containing protein [Alkalicoccobacillus plakortidis]|uniref:NERD domain-containing protein n=1 Tax=Alkalicoccobacillus plakortidis TaxID=444060 RepID=A0ABT0XKV0_9BACI|nr:nuclease-related domain-containing protein [Alkalicoccobacillus plakortidis]MCM2676536.1 NERD domain-containing protein [Alkalicoccobacillus plakortidis]
MRIAKKRAKPLYISKLEALLRRLPENHPKATLIKQDLLKRQIGYRGEKSLDFYLDSLSMQKELTILHDLRLRGENGHFFQIDTILINPSLIIILEVKNIAGSLYLNPLTQQMIRTTRTTEEVFHYPLLQTQMQKNQLKEWLASHQWPLLQLVDLIVVSDPTTRIVVDSTNQHLMNQVIHAARLPDSISKILRKQPEHSIPSQKLNELVLTLIKNHIESSIEVLSKYEIGPTELECGVNCPSCLQLSMQRKKGRRVWICDTCGKTSKNAHFQSLEDYFLLIEPTITNRSLRHFLKIESPQLAHSLLSSNCPSFTGTYKNRTYTIPYPLLP